MNKGIVQVRYIYWIGSWKIFPSR